MSEKIPPIIESQPTLPAEQMGKATVGQIVVIMRKENVLLPLYSDAGDLIWPKKMSYEEVKKFVAEREHMKKEGGEVGT